jgi:hypothetical protein
VGEEPTGGRFREELLFCFSYWKRWCEAGGVLCSFCVSGVETTRYCMMGLRRGAFFTSTESRRYDFMCCADLSAFHVRCTACVTGRCADTAARNNVFRVERDALTLLYLRSFKRGVLICEQLQSQAGLSIHHCCTAIEHANTSRPFSSTLLNSKRSTSVVCHHVSNRQAQRITRWLARRAHISRSRLDRVRVEQWQRIGPVAV